MNIPNTFYRVSIKALILDDEQRFLLFLEDSGLWELPGGGLDHGEEPHQCLRRELKEEAGLEVVAIQPQPSYFETGLTDKGQPKANIIYKVEVKDLAFTPTTECRELRFFTREEALKEKLNSVVLEFVRVYSPPNH